MASRQRVSDQLKAQDAIALRGIVTTLEAIRSRYPQSLKLKGATRDLDDFVKELARQIKPEESEPLPPAEGFGEVSR